MNGTPEPTMQPLHPDKPEPAIGKGDIWVKIATGKASVSAPRVRIDEVHDRGLTAVPMNFTVGHGWNDGHWEHCNGERYIRFAVFCRDWRPC